MFSLTLAMIYVACKVMFSETEFLAAFEATLPFLWYWHMTFAVIKAGFLGLIPVIGAVLATSGKDDEKNWIAGLGLLAASPILFVLMMISSALFLGGVYALDSGIQGGQVINQSHVTVGCILYGLAMLGQLRGTTTSSSSKD
jgi:hypothetical protein